MKYKLLIMNKKDQKNSSSRSAKKLSFLKKSSRFFSNGLFKTIAKHSILPATIFNSMQLTAINKEFNRFWGIEEKRHKIKKNPNFSTFTLGSPTCLWSYYFKDQESIDELYSKYALRPFRAKTSDGIKLCGMHFVSSRGHQTNARTLIVFNGNGELYKIGSSAWLLRLLKDSPVPYNIVMFDHRETGNSTGKAHSKGLILDGEAIYDHVNIVLDVHEDQIDLCGFSLGGAIATLVKARHSATEGALISNRSFQSLEHAVKGMFSKLANPLENFLAKIATNITKRSGWVLDPFDAWKSITSRKMVICHENDPIVAHSASMEKALVEEDLIHDCKHVRLVQKNPDKNIRNHHVQPLSYYNDHKGNDVEKSVLEFLLNFDKKTLEGVS
ncbi:hypothetical protein COB11_05740 [Candidatus Aerophobetes bacterium]|uniref:Serine aminopeptidase S33 domain-containing protein n=1 Tax=Aerophobetes bacterium TaxID=2030807 RepID=A0A2A4YEP4_UNCAE|nr:MAG: hypothetical protein COB11_05740 [Candidatus Aerophobetes bacterium]